MNSNMSVVMKTNTRISRRSIVNHRGLYTEEEKLVGRTNSHLKQEPLSNDIIVETMTYKTQVVCPRGGHSHR